MRLDFREAPFGLHCDAARAEALREERLAQMLGGEIACGNSARAERLLRRQTVRHPSSPHR